MKITGTIKSKKGFYIGDLCYALNDEVYDKVWGGAGYEDGIHTEPVTGCSFAVAGTAYGDGTYEDDSLKEYDVDAGNISLVPGELVEDTDGGQYFDLPGEATFEAEEGIFNIVLPNGQRVHIDTTAEDWEEEEDDYYEEDYDEEDEWED